MRCAVYVCGVCADGIFGECLFWALKLVLGPEYDAVTHMGWVKIFSRVLRAMVPVAIEYELENKEALKSRVTSRYQALASSLDKQASVRRPDTTTSVSEDALSFTARSLNQSV